MDIYRRIHSTKEREEQDLRGETQFTIFEELKKVISIKRGAVV
jgi:hypothetical protein